MSENKKISYLNSKVWYRLLKVIFLGALVLSLSVWNFSFLSDIGFTQIDKDKTHVYCTYGDMKTFSLEQIGISLYPYDFKNGFEYKNFFEDSLNKYKIKQIFQSCYPQTKESIDIFAAQKVYEIFGDERLRQKQETRSPLSKDEKAYLDETIPKIESLYSDKEKSQYLDYSVQLFTIRPVTTHSGFFENFIFGNITILALFEIARRIFYYIVLGKLRPEK